MTQWGADKAKQVYNIAHWSDGYFDIDPQGFVVAYPDGDKNKPGVRLDNLVRQMAQQKLHLPVLVRFTDILQSRVDRLVSAFADAKADKNYTGKYTAVYPIKVNQQQSVVRKIIEHHSGKVGLEAGSKPELLAILGVTTRPIRIVCNGYKDREFLRLATIGSMLGHDVFVVIEKLSELPSLLSVINELGYAPKIGIRIRLASAAKGRWQNSGGEKGKFGLNASQVLNAISILREAGQLSLLQLVHFHIGSQVANIRDIHRAMRECARHYASLHELGVPINCVDVGGGLGVDYEGSGSRNACSMNYSMAEYARNVVAGLADICQELNLPHPDIISESGRAITAHHAMLITNLIETEKAPGQQPPSAPDDSACMITQELWQRYNHIRSARSGIEAYHDAIHCYADAQEQYTNGLITLTDWADVEQLYFACMQKVRGYLNPAERNHRQVLDELNEKLADKLFCNFSLFQSLPDVWGIDQLFPVLPLQNLEQPLTSRAVIQDITCDSDGQISQYADGDGIEASLPLPAYASDADLTLGMFMVGAYQEILGDMHNLFGDTHSVHVELNQSGEAEIKQIINGENAADVLRYVHFSPEQLLGAYQIQLNQTDFTQPQRKALFAELKAGIDGYTYFEDES